MEHKKMTPNFFFLSVGVLITLIASVSSFLTLVFSTLDHVFPDVLRDQYISGYASYAFEDMRAALAIVVIVFPVFLVLSRYWLAALRKPLSYWDTVLRRWALYLILFLASVTVIVDLVTLVRYFVSGEITIRFILKVLIVLIVSGLILWYYRFHVQEKRSVHVHRICSGISTILVLSAVIWAFSVMGSPASQRQLRLDQRRIEDLQSIQWSVITFWQQREQLPESLAALSDPLSSYLVPRDPEFQKGMEYEYRVVSKDTFELCATFSLPLPVGWVPGGSDSIGRDSVTTSLPYPGISFDQWEHDVGRTCFTRTIDPIRYPPFPKERL